MGSNTDGKLGIGQHTITHSNVPCLVDNLSGIVKVACGGGHTLAIGTTGQAFSWGQGYNGALGLNETGNQDRPRIITVPISTQRVIDLAAGSRHSLFLTDQQKVYSCGESKMG
jgi:alpha-tubulin suppressor-like RCC1 family protein